MLYQGSRYTGEMKNSSDEIMTHYFAPQISIRFLKQSFSWYMATGCGYQLYKDNSIVYEKPRKVSMNKFASNFALGGEYRPFTHWGISAKINYIMAFAKDYCVSYHGKEWMVEPNYPFKGANDISQLSFSAGINYHF